MSKTYEVIRATSGADEFDGDVLQVVDWAMVKLINNGDEVAINSFYKIPSYFRGQRFERALIKWAVDSLKGEFRIREID